MDFTALRTQVMALLQGEGRVAYRALKLQFQLDDDTLAALKDDLIYAKRLAVDEEGRVLVWTGGRRAHSQPPRQCHCPPHRTSLRRRARPYQLVLLHPTLNAANLR
jgi:hypothetical protein